MWALNDDDVELPDVWDSVTCRAHRAGGASAGAGVPMRLMRVTRMAGLVAEAVHGAMGTNPRKGSSHTWEDVHQRLAALIIQVMELLASLTGDVEAVFSRRLSQIAERSGALR